jgi:hypothetical protein
MPQMLRLVTGFAPVPVATEAELLDFCNKMRAAGDADPIGSLLPSSPGNAYECLVANACNFNSTVRPSGVRDEDTGALNWIMYFPYNMETEHVERIAASVGCETSTHEYNGTTMRLPEHIGNAAHAFDLGLAFTDYYKEA